MCEEESHTPRGSIAVLLPPDCNLLQRNSDCNGRMRETRDGPKSRRMRIRRMGSPQRQWRRKIRVKFLAACIVFWLALLGAVAAADSPQMLSTVTITGQVPGPALWKVTKGAHTMWVMGTVDLLPKKIEWYSKDVETAIASSQQVIGISYGSLNVNVFARLFQLSSVEKIPDGKHLGDILPADLYTRWTAVKTSLGVNDDDVERLRPRYAADALFDKAAVRAGLSDDPDVWETIKQLARKHHVGVVTKDFKFAIDNSRQRMKRLQEAPLEPEFACLSSALDRLQSDVATVEQRANAWSYGDLATLRKLALADRDQLCWDSLSNADDLSESVRELNRRLDNDWIGAVDNALDRNTTSFAVLPLSDLLNGTGRVALLRERGYAIIAPDN